jgi:integrase
MSKKMLSALHEFITAQKPSEENLLAKIKALAYENNPADRTITTRYSAMKKHVREMHPEYSDEFIRKIAPPRELTMSVISRNQEQRNKKKLVEFGKAEVDKLLSWRNDESPFKRMAFLQFVSGRRVNEIYDNEIGPLPRKNPRSIKMKLSKKNGDAKDKFYSFELIGDAGIDNKSFKKELRETRKALTGIDLSSFTQRLNKVLKRDLRNDISSHDLRSMYAVYRFNTENEEKQNLTGYIAKILNHAETSDSGIAYSNFTYKEEA